MIYRGTTPTLKFMLPFNPAIFTHFYITFSQDNKIVLEKTITDCIFTENSATIHLTQRDTLGFNAELKVAIQIRCKDQAGEAYASVPIVTSIKEILKDGEI